MQREEPDGPVVVEDLRYAYPGSDGPAVRGVSFAIQPGEIVGFLGPSGAGKSTTQKVLTGLLDEYEGNARVFGREVRDWGGAYYDRIGVSAESPNHYLKLTGRENLRLFASLYGGETADPDSLLDRVGLADAADRPVGGYSKGMKMRLNLARSLLDDPSLLFLDEPTTGLDPHNARTVLDIVRERRRAGATVFLTAHDMAVADAPSTLKRIHGDPRVRVEGSTSPASSRRTGPRRRSSRPRRAPAGRGRRWRSAAPIRLRCWRRSSGGFCGGRTSRTGPSLET